MPKAIYDVGTVASFLILILAALFACLVASYINELQGSGIAIKKLGLHQTNKVYDMFYIDDSFWYWNYFFKICILHIVIEFNLKIP